MLLAPLSAQGYPENAAEDSGLPLWVNGFVRLDGDSNGILMLFTVKFKHSPASTNQHGKRILLSLAMGYQIRT